MRQIEYLTINAPSPLLPQGSVQKGECIFGSLRYVCIYVCMYVCMYVYHSLAKEHPLTKECPPLLWPNFLYRVKVYLNEHPPWSKLHVEFEKHSLKCYAYLR